MKQKKIEEYEINTCTMLLRPVEYGSKVYTHVFEEEEEFLSPFRPLEIIKKSCDYFGCDYESRKKGTRQLIGYTRKIPIVIEPSNHLFYFPTSSPNGEECIWISHDHVENYHRIGPQQTMVTFRNKQSYSLPVSFCTIEGQMLRTARLKTKILQRIEHNGRKQYYFMQKPDDLKASENKDDYSKPFHLK